jgi:hypothetical protein
MFWFSLMHLCTFLLEWLRIGRLSEREKDLEILLLRQQVTILERQVNGPLHVVHDERACPVRHVARDFLILEFCYRSDNNPVTVVMTLL